MNPIVDIRQYMIEAMIVNICIDMFDYKDRLFPISHYASGRIFDVFDTTNISVAEIGHFFNEPS